MINTTPLMRHLTQGIPNRPIMAYVKEWNEWIPGTPKALLDRLKINIADFIGDWEEYNSRIILIKPNSKLAVWFHLKNTI